MRVLHPWDDPDGEGLLDRDPHPSEEEIRFAIAGNLCRCTGYTKIVEAIQTVAIREPGVEAREMTEERRVDADRKAQVLGVSVPRLDGFEKVTGRARFGADIYLPRMLHGKILRSRYPHAKYLLNIRTEKAERVPGVKAVVTWKDAPDVMTGMYQNDWRIFAKEKVRYLGDVVAAVAAIDEETACEALELIEVEYEELPAVFDPLEASSPGAPLLHDSFPENIGARRRSQRRPSKGL